ncbi:MAG: hypothetical protein AB8H80_01780 [Planctomycetota bacterium]
MQTSFALGAGVLLTTAAFVLRPSDSGTLADGTPATPPMQALEPVILPAPPPPQADGHYVLVVEGDRNQLDVTFASRKTAPWGGVPKGFAGSGWAMRVTDAEGNEICSVPLDMRPFATSERALGQPVQVRGCVLVDSKIGMLVSVPAYDTATNYEFLRPADAGGDQQTTIIGSVSGANVRELAGEER